MNKDFIYGNENVTENVTEDNVVTISNEVFDARNLEAVPNFSELAGEGAKLLLDTNFISDEWFIKKFDKRLNDYNSNSVDDKLEGRILYTCLYELNKMIFNDKGKNYNKKAAYRVCDSLYTIMPQNCRRNKNYVFIESGNSTFADNRMLFEALSTSITSPVYVFTQDWKLAYDIINNVNKLLSVMHNPIKVARFDRLTGKLYIPNEAQVAKAIADIEAKKARDEKSLA